MEPFHEVTFSPISTVWKFSKSSSLGTVAVQWWLDWLETFTVRAQLSDVITSLTVKPLTVTIMCAALWLLFPKSAVVHKQLKSLPRSLENPVNRPLFSEKSPCGKTLRLWSWNRHLCFFTDVDFGISALIYNFRWLCILIGIIRACLQGRSRSALLFPSCGSSLTCSG